MSAIDQRGTTVYETEYLEAHYTSRRGTGYTVRTKKCVACGTELDPNTGIGMHLKGNAGCRETLLKRLES